MNPLKDFKKFTLPARSCAPKISLRKTGQIGFNAAFYEKYKLINFNYVSLYYSQRLNEVAIKFYGTLDDGATHKMTKNISNWFVSGKSFLDFNNIDYSSNIKLTPNWIKNSDIAIIKLNEINK